MKRQLKVAVLQLAAVDREDFSRSTPELLEKLRTCADAGAELIVFPEGTVPAYVLGPSPLQESEYARTIEEIGAFACERNVHIAGGVAIAEGVTDQEAAPRAGVQPNLRRQSNAAAIFHPDGRIDLRAKRFLWHFDRLWFAPGTTTEPVRTKIGILGVLVCADGRIPTIASSLVNQGAELLVMPTAWVTGGTDFGAMPNIQADLMARMRAWENGVPFIAANKSGYERRSVAYCGKSQICDGAGNIVACASATAPEILYATIEIGEPAPRRRKIARSTAPSNSGRHALHTFASVDVDATKNESNAWVRRIGVALDDATELRDVARWSNVDILFVLDAAVRDESAPTTATTQEFVEPAAAAGDAVARSTAQPHVVDGGRLPVGTVHDIAGVAVCATDDDAIADPEFLAARRLKGMTIAVWRSALGDRDLQLRLARLRAIELRAYVIILDLHARTRCLIIDPDGTVAAGTSIEYRLAQAAYDHGKVERTDVAPGSDILAGLHAMAESQH